MPFKADKIWFDGEMVNWADAKVHILSHALHYGTSSFEGLRCYKNKNGSSVMRLKDHVKRLFDSCKIYRIEIPYSREEVENAILDTLRVNKLEEAYIRPFVFRGFGELGINPFKCPVHTSVAAWNWGKYLGPDALENGVSVRVSSWSRPAPNTFPSLAKVGANYMNSQLIKMEALQDGFDEGIALDAYGYVSEGSGENIFMIKNGVIYTPPTSSSILAGITRHSIFVIARNLKIRVEQHLIPREALYIADEVFFTGTAVEITPVVKIDNIPISNGKRGTITAKLQDEFFGIIQGKTPDPQQWLTYL
ncbi:MAG: branched-chain amino acid transaminase [Spirochaetes bacterium]|nr:branched-chain amino acid transaminase [Spirochaetota bacterium]